MFFEAMHYFISILGRLLTISMALCISSVAPAKENSDDNPRVMIRLTALRDSFVLKTKRAEFTCPLAPPTILLTDKASFGSYEPGTNTLQTPTWQQLAADEKVLFVQLAGPGAATKSVLDRFERGVHRWIFIHEMGHWWQACTRANQGRSPYQVEYDANRIAAAYWQELDPKFMDDMFAGFQQMLEHTPRLVPADETPERYFNENYAKLIHTAGYTWFQAQMITTVNGEKPVPTFAQSLNERK
jgi:hypothetical protein